jgi:hypothetical protein
MNNLTVIILLCFTFGWSLNVKSQNLEKKKIDETIEADSFPQSWLGNWVGELNIYKENKLVQTLPMELEMLAIDTSENFVWAIIYGEDKVAGRRSYELEILDAEKGIYRIDEKNTIKLECYLFGNKLYSQFSVMESQILCTYEKVGDKMFFEIISGSTEPVSITGDKIVEEEDIPEVKTFPITVMQKAVLIRKK